MEFQIRLDLPPHRPAIAHSDKILLIGSCFTEHISKRMEEAKFRVMANPHGILFNPLSVCKSLDRYVSGEAYGSNDLFCLNGIWNGWDFHTRFSDTDSSLALQNMNRSVKQAAAFIREADWLIITLGSSYQYFLCEGEQTGYAVANCHRAPGQWFEKRLLGIDETAGRLQAAIGHIRTINPALKVILTISPVRHIRDGVINNNRSKARLIEAVHQVTADTPHCSYFPAYELVIDVLRDYRFYDIDMVHPNYTATQFVWEQFSKVYFEEDTTGLIKQLTDIHTARNHKPRFPHTETHRKFMSSYAEKVAALERLYPYLDLSKEKTYFGID